MDHSEFYWEVALRLHDMGMQSNAQTRPNPEKALPIDMFLKDSAARDVEPRIDPSVRHFYTRKFGSFDGWLRQYLGFTFEGVAALDPSRRQKISSQIQALRRDSHLFSQQMQTFCRKNCPHSTSSYMLDEQTGEVCAAYSVLMIAIDEHLRELTDHMAILLDFVDERLEEVSPVVGGRPQERWKRFFVGAMARAWFLLTGSPPKANPHGRFAEFVDAAWHSGGAMPSISWDQSIRCLPSCISEYERYQARIKEVVNRYGKAEAA